MFGKGQPGSGQSGARVWRLILWPVTALYCAVVASIVFAPVHVDDNEMGGRLAQLLDTGHAEGWLPAFITYSSIEQLSNVIMFMPGGFLFALLLKPKARPHVLYAGFMPDRTGDPVDVLMNGSGALLGAAGALGVHRWRRVRRERKGK